MKKLASLAFIVATVGVLLSGCNGTKNPVENSSHSDREASGDFSQTTVQSLVSTDITLAGFQVHYDGPPVGSSSTTFTYKVDGPAVDMHFRVELPSCAPDFSVLSPANGTTTNNDADINPGVEWHPGTGSGPFTFSITYPSPVRVGLVSVSIKTTNTTEVGQILGACARVFDISGTVFTDANSNRAFDGGETGMENITVNLVSDNMVVDTKATDEYGFYIFEAFPNGSYTIEVDQNTLPSNIYLGITTPTSIDINVEDANSSGNNFGFAPNTKKLITDLKFGTLTTTGKSASYWKKQFQVAISGKGTPDYDLQSFVEDIRHLLLTDPFTLPNGDGLKDALAILSNPTKTDVATLKQQLLAAELNYRAGFGVDPDLHLVLLGWGESLVLSNSTTSTAAAGKATAKATAMAASTLSEAVDLFTQLNSSGGGGGGH